MLAACIFTTEACNSSINKNSFPTATASEREDDLPLVLSMCHCLSPSQACAFSAYSFLKCLPGGQPVTGRGCPNIAVNHCTFPNTAGAGVPTLVLAIVHPVLGGVVVFNQTSALGGIGFIRNVLDVLFGCRLTVLLCFLAISQWLEHSQIITVLLWLCDLGVSGTLALWNAAEAKRSNHEQWRWTPPSLLRVGMFYWKVLQHEPTHQMEIKSLIDWQ